MKAAASSSATPVALPWGLAWRLAVGQIVAWGILYYAFTVVVGPMQAGTGWSRTFLNAGLSLGLLAWGLCAFPVGAWIQRRGGRGVMTAAAALGGIALMVMGLWPQRVLYLIAWLMVGAAMAGILYDSAFAVVTRAFGAEYRRGIALIALVGGLASTVFIPLAQLAVAHLGWQHALVALGAFQLLLGGSLHRFGVPRFEAVSPDATPPQRKRGVSWWAELRRDVFDPRFVGLALWFTAHAAALTGLIFQLVPILQALQVESATMLQAIALIGPMQVLGRLLLTTRRDGFSTLRVGQWAMASLILSTLILLLLPPRLACLAAFAALYGLGNGVSTLLRGTAIAELFGRERYAELNGALSAPAVLAKAAAPLGLAAFWSMTGEPRAVLVGVLALLGLGTAGLVMAQRAASRPEAGSSEAMAVSAAAPSVRAG